MFINLKIARKQRLLPVQCWEKTWVTPRGALPGSTYKVLKWVKTDKKQVNFLGSFLNAVH